MNEYAEKNVIANPLIVLREEFDDWAILFDPDTGNTFGLNPIGVLIWKHLDGHHTLNEITEKIREAAENVPSDVSSHVQDFVQNAVKLGLVNY
ncbi:MAG: SynChlorMet cassette protein ScmD [Candidatus Tectomicrobia bacterium]|uniref:SynChlorMet cassette protein ScmD n=1 Tax=Tectimicrobiota bacterium TaxID=2528274 RepID=A0A933GLT7_UNCTE|nr:SynChlorMet cassette protein ScmD [Candidatus Tectomicrobia bacterium]